MQLLDPDTVPRVHRVTSLDCSDTIIRLVSLPLVDSRLPNLEKFNWDYLDMIKPLNSVRRRRDRYSMYEKLLQELDPPADVLARVRKTLTLASQSSNTTSKSQEYHSCPEQREHRDT